MNIGTPTAVSSPPSHRRAPLASHGAIGGFRILLPTPSPDKTMPIEIDHQPSTGHPAWCPSCGESNPKLFPVEMPGGLTGCLACTSHWTPEQFAQIYAQGRHVEMSTVSIEDVRQQIARAITLRTHIDGGPVGDSRFGLAVRFKEDLGLSVDEIRSVATHLGEAFNVKISNEALQYCHSVDEMVFCIRLLVASNRRRQSVAS
jgi:hypothetical protein